MIAAVYARKSTKDEQGVERQVEIARDFITAKGRTVGPVFTDDDISGAVLDRDGLNGLLAAVTAKSGETPRELLRLTKQLRRRKYPAEEKIRMLLEGPSAPRGGRLVMAPSSAATVSRPATGAARPRRDSGAPPDVLRRIERAATAHGHCVPYARQARSSNSTSTSRPAAAQ